MEEQACAAAAPPKDFQRFVAHDFSSSCFSLCHVPLMFEEFLNPCSSPQRAWGGPKWHGLLFCYSVELHEIWTRFIYTASSLIKFVLSFRAAKSDAKTAIRAHVAQMQTTPFRQLLTPDSWPISSPCWTPGIAQETPLHSTDNTEILSGYNTSMDEIASNYPVRDNPWLHSWTPGRIAVQHNGSIPSKKQPKTVCSCAMW